MSRVFKFSCFVLSVVCIYACSTVKNDQGPKWTQEERNLLVNGLQNSFDSLESAIQNIDNKIAFTRPDSTAWSIEEVVEHLLLQDLAYYRELTAVSVRPEEQSFPEDLRKNDKKFLEYATDPKAGQADWFAVPAGNYKDFKAVIDEYREVRKNTIQFVASTTSDLRRHYTYRDIPDQLLSEEFYKVREVRDLHQLVLNEIAHTRRHLGQIMRVKEALEIE